MSYSPAKPTVAPFIRVLTSFSDITIGPFHVGEFLAPAVMGTVFTVLPSRTTVIRCAEASTVET